MSEYPVPEDLREWITRFMVRESRWALEHNGDSSYALMVEYYEKTTPAVVLNLLKDNARLESENTRLREALEEIIKRVALVSPYYEMARAALAEKGLI